MQYNSGDIFGLNRRRVVSGDGTGCIYTTNGDNTDWVMFPHLGWDPSYCWGGNAIIFASYDHRQVCVANIDGSGLYTVPIVGTYVTRPQLAGNNSLYLYSSLTSLNLWDVYVCGGGGYNPVRLIQSAISPGCINWHGTTCYAGGRQGSTGPFRICKAGTTAPYAFSWVPYTPPNANFPDALMPATSPVVAIVEKIAFAIGNFTGLDLRIPQTYGYSAIMVSGADGSSQIKATTDSVGPGYLVYTPSFWPDGSGVIYDFVTPAGSGTWAVGIPAWGGSGSGGVFGNPFGGTYQFLSRGHDRVNPQLPSGSGGGGG